MNSQERFEFCEKAFVDNHFDIHHTELELPKPEGPTYDDGGYCTNSPTNTAPIITGLRSALKGDWDVMPVNQAWFDATEAPNTIDDAAQYVTTTGAPAVGLHRCDKSLRPDWLWARYQEKIAEHGGGGFASALSTLSGALRRKQSPPKLIHDAAQTLMETAVADGDSAKKLIQQSGTQMRRLK